MYLLTAPVAALALLASTIALTLDAPALAQYIPPPHSNDPHPPANQPSYQLRPFARPGVPGVPGAAHSNDPYYRKTEPQITWPKTMPIPDSSPRITPPVQGAPLAPRGGRPRAERARPPAKNLKECLSRWSPREAISQAEWNAACRRLEVSGRVRTE